MVCYCKKILETYACWEGTDYIWMVDAFAVDVLDG